VPIKYISYVIPFGVVTPHITGNFMDAVSERSEMRP
jgi:hypothetical protein